MCLTKKFDLKFILYPSCPFASHLRATKAWGLTWLPHLIIIRKIYGVHGFWLRTLRRRQTFSILFRDCRLDYPTSEGDFIHRQDKRQPQVTMDILGLRKILTQLDVKDISWIAQFWLKLRRETNFYGYTGLCIEYGAWIRVQDYGIYQDASDELGWNLQHVDWVTTVDRTETFLRWAIFLQKSTFSWSILRHDV